MYELFMHIRNTVGDAVKENIDENNLTVSLSKLASGFVSVRDPAVFYRCIKLFSLFVDPTWLLPKMKFRLDSLSLSIDLCTTMFVLVPLRIYC
jgi:hypothetical protein